MKTRPTSLLAASAIATGLLTSCATPHDPNLENSGTILSYQPGYRINSLPSGYRREVISGNDYYYYNGAYYRPESTGYVVVDAPRESRYYTEYDLNRSNLYNRGTSNPRETVNESMSNVDRLPAGYREVKYGGSQYYQVGENYYRRQGTGYVSVSRPY